MHSSAPVSGTSMYEKFGELAWAERAVKTIKEGMKKAGDVGSIDCRIYLDLYPGAATVGRNSSNSPSSRFMVGDYLHIVADKMLIE